MRKPDTFLIIGLGSMGKRRIRNLQALQAGEILGFDLREDRRKEAQEKYGIKTVKDLKLVNLKDMGAIFVCTPPDKHSQYIQFAIENRKPAFVEASVILEGLGELDGLAKKKRVLIAPSCTFHFHPVVKDIKQIIKSKKYGKVTNFIYHSGQYLPDWHPWEKVTDFYAGKKETGGAREIVPFEVTWIVDILGFPRKITGFYGETMDVGAKIDDTYVLAMDFGKAFGCMMVDVVSRYGTRSLVLNMEKGQIVWRWDEGSMRLYEAETQRWISYKYPEGKTVAGYNVNIIEDMYIEEVKTFLGALKKKAVFPNSLDKDMKVLKLLYQAEGRPTEKERGWLANRPLIEQRQTRTSA